MILSGVTYEMPEIDFNAVCLLDTYGFDLMSGNKDISPLAQIRAITAFASGTSLAISGKLIEAHVEDGGDFQTFAQATFEEFNKAVADSGFLQQMAKSFQAKQKTSNKKNSKPTADEQEI